MKNEIVTITGFKRMYECWVCSQCDSENPTVAGRCIVCGRQKSNRDRIIDPIPKNTDSFSYIDRERDEQVVSVVDSDIPKAYSELPPDIDDKRNNWREWLPVIIVLLLILILGCAYCLEGNASDDYPAATYDAETLQIVDASEDYIDEKAALPEELHVQTVTDPCAD